MSSDSSDTNHHNHDHKMNALNHSTMDEDPPPPPSHNNNNSHQNTLDRLLKEAGLEYADLDPAALMRIPEDDDGEGLARVVRLAKTNHELRKHGLNPLLMARSFSEEAEMEAQDNDEDEESQGRHSNGQAQREAILMRHMGITREEKRTLESMRTLSLEQYMAIRGDYGTLFGLKLSKDAFDRARRACYTRAACALQDDEQASLKFMHGILRKIASKAIRGKTATTTTTTTIITSSSSSSKSKPSKSTCKSSKKASS